MSRPMARHVWPSIMALSSYDATCRPLVGVAAPAGAKAIATMGMRLLLPTHRLADAVVAPNEPCGAAPTGDRRSTFDAAGGYDRMRRKSSAARASPLHSSARRRAVGHVHPLRRVRLVADTDWWLRSRPIQKRCWPAVSSHAPRSAGADGPPEAIAPKTSAIGSSERRSTATELVVHGGELGPGASKRSAPPSLARSAERSQLPKAAAPSPLTIERRRATASIVSSKGAMKQPCDQRTKDLRKARSTCWC